MSFHSSNKIVNNSYKCVSTMIVKQGVQCNKCRSVGLFTVNYIGTTQSIIKWWYYAHSMFSSRPLFCKTLVLLLYELFYDLFIYLGFYVAFNTLQVISWRVVGRAEETSTYSSSGFCIVNCRPTASNYQLSHLRPCREPNPGLRRGRRECYHSDTVAPDLFYECQSPELGLYF